MTQSTLLEMEFYDRTELLCAKLGFLANIIGCWDFTKQEMYENDQWAIARIIDEQIDEVKKLQEELRKHS